MAIGSIDDGENGDDDGETASMREITIPTAGRDQSISYDCFFCVVVLDAGDL